MTDAVTVNFRLNLPEFDERFYHGKVNDNFITIDAIIKTYLDVLNIVGVWENSTAYDVGDKTIDPDAGVVYECVASHVSAASPTTFGEDRILRPTLWTAPVIPARGLGAWASGTHYIAGDFVVADGLYYAVALVDHIASGAFLTDVAMWDVLIDVSSLQAIPAFTGHASNYVRVKSDESDLEYVAVGTLAVDLGLGTLAYLSTVLGTMATQAANAVAITGGTLAGITSLTFGGSGLADLKTLLGLGTAAFLNAGTAVNNLVQMAAGPKLPAVDGSALTNMNIPTIVARTNNSCTITFGGSATGITTSINTLSWWQVGLLVHFIINITFTSNGTGVGACVITMTGAPLADVSAVHLLEIIANGSTLANTLFAQQGAGRTLALMQQGAAAEAALTDTNITNTCQLRISGVYATT